MTVTLDIAAVVNAVLWPALLLAILLAYRRKLPPLIGALASRVNKVELPALADCPTR